MAGCASQMSSLSSGDSGFSQPPDSHPLLYLVPVSMQGPECV